MALALGKNMKRFPLLLFAFVIAGCGPLVSGTWSDDPKNWERAFEEYRPNDGIKIIHSWYMRTPHFTAEYAWFFELELTEKAKNDVVKNDGFSKLPTLSPDDLRSRIYSDCPKWFSPEPLSDYDTYESKTNRGFLILIEKNGSRSFWTHYQL